MDNRDDIRFEGCSLTLLASLLHQCRSPNNNGSTGINSIHSDRVTCYAIVQVHLHDELHYFPWAYGNVIDNQYIMRYYIQIVIIVVAEREYMMPTTCTSNNLPKRPNSWVADDAGGPA